MKRADFAALVGISRPMLSKYETAGCVVIVGNEVEPVGTLANLAGRLDEAKRRQALKSIGAEMDAPAEAEAPPMAPKPRIQTARQDLDEIKRDIARLDYGERAALLVLASAVEDAATQAVADMREVFANSRRDAAAEICAKFNLPPENAGPMQRLLNVYFERALGRFSEAMARLAVPATAATTPERAETVA